MEEEKKVLSFSFYEETSYEDAGPYCQDNKMIVCDGCGGAGGFYHHVDPEKIDSFDKIKKLVLQEETDNSSDWFLEEYFKPIYENPTINRTSAFWASRIALARYVFYMNDEKSLPTEAADFVTKGLRHVAKELDFQIPLIGSKTLLPTTLVAIYVRFPDSKHVDAEVWWAGDSRAYAIIGDGLKQLTYDHEDETGAITNFFTARDDFEANIQPINHEFAYPCALFTCSDGLFDNLSPLDFEYVLLEIMQEANSIEEYKEKLAAFYHAHKGDDCTMAFMAFGFDDYQAMKEYYSPRATYIRELHHQYIDYHDYLALKKNPDAYQDYYQKIVNRTKDKQRDILLSILNEYKNKGESKFINEELIKEIEEDYASTLAKNAELFEQKKEKALLLAEEEIIASFKEAPLSLFFKMDELKDYQREILEPLIAKQSDVVDCAMRIKVFEQDKNGYRRYCERLMSSINRIIDALDSAGIIERHEVAQKKKEFAEKINNGDWEKEEIEELLNIASNLDNDPSLKEVFLNFSNYVSRANRADIDEAFIEKTLPELEEGLDQLFTNLDDVYLVLDEPGFKNPEVEKALKELIDLKPQEEKINITPDLLMRYFEIKGPQKIVDLRLKIGKEETVIDYYYNQTLLRTLISYYQAMNNSSDDFDKFYEEYLKFNEDVTSLLNKKRK